MAVGYSVYATDINHSRTRGWYYPVFTTIPDESHHTHTFREYPDQNFYMLSEGGLHYQKVQPRGYVVYIQPADILQINEIARVQAMQEELRPAAELITFESIEQDIINETLEYISGQPDVVSISTVTSTTTATPTTTATSTTGVLSSSGY
jgi:hypothetical protein